MIVCTEKVQREAFQVDPDVPEVGFVFDYLERGLAKGAPNG